MIIKKLFLYTCLGVILCNTVFAQCTEGDCINEGTFTGANGNVYEGEFRWGKKHGQGTYTWSNGNKYIGEWKDNKQNGQGTYTWTSGAKYAGEWKDNERNGQGTYTWASGNKYVGEWKDNERNGQGTFTWSDGDTYVGEFSGGKKHGQGTMTGVNGDKYVGEFKDNERNGQGTYTWSNGNKYIGEFKVGVGHGQGTFTYEDGSKYVGEYKDGKKHGQGTFTGAEGTVDNGIWNKGELVKRNTIKTQITKKEPSQSTEQRTEKIIKNIMPNKYLGNCAITGLSKNMLDNILKRAFMFADKYSFNTNFKSDELIYCNNYRMNITFTKIPYNPDYIGNGQYVSVGKLGNSNCTNFMIIDTSISNINDQMLLIDLNTQSNKFGLSSDFRDQNC